MKLKNLAKIALASSAGVLMALCIMAAAIGIAISAPRATIIIIIIVILIILAHIQIIKMLTRASENSGKRHQLINALLTKEERETLSYSIDVARDVNVIKFAEWNRLRKIVAHEI